MLIWPAYLILFSLNGSGKIDRPFGLEVAVPIAPQPRLAHAGSLEAHLAGWERTTSSLTSIRVDLTLRRTDPAGGIQKVETQYTGGLVAMRPNYLRLRLDNGTDPKDFEAFICNGKSIYAYNGLQKTITENRLPDVNLRVTDEKSDSSLTLVEVKLRNWFRSRFSESILLELLRGMRAQDLKSRFEVRLFKEDANYIYLDLKPVLDTDKSDVKQLRVALYQPRHARLGYLPAQVFLVRPNGETEQWKLSNHMTNIQEINEKVFQFEEVPGYRFQKAPEPKPHPAKTPGLQMPVVGVEVPACGEGWAVPVVPSGRVRRGFCGWRSGLFRNRNAGYKCATAGHVPVTGWVYGVQSCEQPVSRSWPSRW